MQLFALSQRKSGVETLIAEIKCPSMTEARRHFARAGLQGTIRSVGDESQPYIAAHTPRKLCIYNGSTSPRKETTRGR